MLPVITPVNFRVRSKNEKQKGRKKRLTCFDCLYSSIYDSEFENKAIRGRIYCRKWESVVQIGCARSCPLFKRYIERNSREKEKLSYCRNHSGKRSHSRNYSGNKRRKGGYYEF